MKNQGPDTFGAAIQQLKQDGLELAGAVQEYTCLKEKQEYLFFPIRRI